MINIQHGLDGLLQGIGRGRGQTRTIISTGKDGSNLGTRKKTKYQSVYLSKFSVYTAKYKVKLPLYYMLTRYLSVLTSKYRLCNPFFYCHRPWCFRVVTSHELICERLKNKELSGRAILLQI